ncbi:hypothetical protein [Rhodovibrio sodomensis]|uniref:hypothetical protein n=1 Tax=Rhodovibrio sodomensis TaxID=1088 RepID=UPI0019059719|nr:hypothetical protein [Rhodovibrio sodomensis]
MNENPFKLDMSFEEAMRRLGRVSRKALDSVNEEAEGQEPSASGEPRDEGESSRQRQRSSPSGASD